MAMPGAITFVNVKKKKTRNHLELVTDVNTLRAASKERSDDLFSRSDAISYKPQVSGTIST